MSDEAREADRLRKENDRLRRVTEASYALHTTLDLGELLGLILEAAKGGVDADRGTVFLLSEDGNELWSRVLTGDGDLEIRLPVGQGIAGSVARTGQTDPPRRRAERPALRRLVGREVRVPDAAAAHRAHPQPGPAT